MRRLYVHLWHNAVDYFGKQFNRGCSYCGGVLRFIICNEVVKGLASVLSFRCSKCYKTTNISTSDTVDVDDNAPYSVNAKVALGKYVIILIYNKTFINSKLLFFQWNVLSVSCFVVLHMLIVRFLFLSHALFVNYTCWTVNNVLLWTGMIHAGIG